MSRTRTKDVELERIALDYLAGNITRKVAIAMLKKFGLTEVEINVQLSVEDDE